MNILKQSFSLLILMVAIGLSARPLQSMGKEPGIVAAPPPLRMAVEYCNHAAAAYLAREGGWFAAAGLEITTYESYLTGMALASALSRSDINTAYLCLVPAITAYANAGVPLKIVAGTHRDGYGLVVDPARVGEIRDLEKPDIRIGCVREGGAVDIIFRKLIDRCDLDRRLILSRTVRMNPAQLVLALRSGRLDAVFLPEHYAAVAEEGGYQLLVRSGDVWPRMPGSVLIVSEKLIREHPRAVERLVQVTRTATEWINRNPAAARLAAVFQAGGGPLPPPAAAGNAGQLQVTPELMARSMARMEYTCELEPAAVQAAIDYLAELDYIPRRFPAAEILDLRYLNP